MRVFCNSCRVFLKISRVCRHLHDKFVCNAHTLMAVIATSDSKLHHTSILVQWTRVRLLCIRKRFKANADTKHLLPYSNNLRGCHHRSNKGVRQQTPVSHIKLLESGTHVINILLLTKRKRMARRRCSTIFKKWDLQVTLPAIYKVHTYVTACIPYSRNISRALTFEDFEDFLLTSKILSSKFLAANYSYYSSSTDR